MIDIMLAPNDWGGRFPHSDPDRHAQSRAQKRFHHQVCQPGGSLKKRHRPRRATPAGRGQLRVLCSARKSTVYATGAANKCSGSPWFLGRRTPLDFHTVMSPGTPARKRFLYNLVQFERLIIASIFFKLNSWFAAADTISRPPSVNTSVIIIFV